MLIIPTDLYIQRRLVATFYTNDWNGRYQSINACSCTSSMKERIGKYPNKPCANTCILNGLFQCFPLDRAVKPRQFSSPCTKSVFIFFGLQRLSKSYLKLFPWLTFTISESWRDSTFPVYSTRKPMSMKRTLKRWEAPRSCSRNSSWHFTSETSRTVIGKAELCSHSTLLFDRFFRGFSAETNSSGDIFWASTPSTWSGSMSTNLIPGPLISSPTFPMIGFRR